ncbi:MAG TPA: DUF2971 domain-containing protein [Chloroflexia bacterium]
MAYIDELLAEHPPAVLYHYTSQKGLLGMIKTRSLWASNIHYMNDYREFYEALRVARSAIKGTSLRTTDPIISNLLSKMPDRLQRTTGIHIYVFCFSASRDALSQWRAYCPSGSGFSVGFSYDTEMASLVESYGFRLIRCLYDPKGQNRLMQELVDDICAQYSNAVGAGTSKSIEELEREHLDEFARRFVEQAAFIKHRGFIEEDEWRLVSTHKTCTDGHSDVREGKSTLVPYYALPITKPGEQLSLQEVVIGPTPHMDLAIDAIEFLICSGRLECADVTPSRTPYQSW